MTVTSTNQKVQFNGNGSTTVFAYNFKIFAQTDLSVILRSAAGTETVQQLTTNYTVSGVGETSGGNVTMGTAPPSGTTLTILRVQPNLQGLDLVPNDPFPAGSMEDALDKLTFMVQTHDEEIGRSIKASTTNTIGNTEFTVSATDRANKLFSFDSSGNLAVTAGKVDTVTASASAVSPGGSPTASATYTAASGALALAFGVVTGANGTTGNSAGLQMTFSNSTSDADPGAGKLALNNGTVSSVNQLFFDDADDNGTNIASFVQSFDDVSNATGRGIIQIEKEGTASTFALFKVTGAVVDAAGYSKVPVAHLVSNGSFSNADGIRVDFSYSGNDGAGSLTEVVQDTSPELGGNLDVLARDIVSSSNRTIDLAPHGTGTVVVRGNTNPGTIVLNCESNTHGQTIKAQPHSASVTNTLTLPAGGNQTLVGTAGATFTGDVTVPDGDLILGSTAVTSTGAEINTLDALSRGSLIYGNASAATAVLTKGGANTVLTSDGTDISWAAAGGGGGAMEFIVSSGAISNAANVSFTQFDAAKYDQYQFWFQHVIPATDEVDMYGYVSTDGGSSYDTTNGNYHLQNTTAKPGLLVAESIGSDTNEFGICGYFELFAPHNSSAFTFSSSGNITYQTRSNGGMYQLTNSSNHLVTQDVDAIQFAMSSGNIESGEIVMYGIKNS